VTGKPRSAALQQTGAAPAPGSPHTLPAPALLNEPYATAHDAVFTLVRLLLNRGIRAEQVAQHTGISPSLLDDPDGRVPLSGFNALWAYTAQVLENPGIALDLHERYPDNRMHFVAHLGMRCATMREAIEQWGQVRLAGVGVGLGALRNARPHRLFHLPVPRPALCEPLVCRALPGAGAVLCPHVHRRAAAH
jgi:hypothetical protein